MDLSIDQLISVSIREFAELPRVPFDLYIRLPNGKFLLVIKAGMTAATAGLSQEAQEHLEEVWVKKTEYRKFVTRTVQTAQTMLAGPKQIPPKSKASILALTANSVFSEIERFGFSQETYSHAKAITNSIVKMVDQKPELTQIMAGLTLCNDRLIDHCIAVSAIAAMVGRELNWQKDQTIEKIALGGMLHDIGKKELSSELLNKPRMDYTHDEIVEYETHPYRGVQILQSVPSIPDDVIAIVYEHHENSFGQGFPRRLREVRINPLARVVALANAFVNLTIPNVNLPKVKTPHEALSFIENVQGRPYNREAFMALKAIVERDANNKKKVA